MHDLKKILVFPVTKGIAQTKKAGSVRQQEDGLTAVKVPNYQIARQDFLELIELNLVLGEPNEVTAFARELPE